MSRDARVASSCLVMALLVETNWNIFEFPMRISRIHQHNTEWTSPNIIGNHG